MLMLGTLGTAPSNRTIQRRGHPNARLVGPGSGSWAGDAGGLKGYAKIEQIWHISEK